MANLTDETQVHDAGGIFKHWQIEAQKIYNNLPPGTSISTLGKAGRVSIFLQAWVRRVTAESTREGFKRVGIFPFNPDGWKTLAYPVGTNLDDPSTWESPPPDIDGHHGFGCPAFLRPQAAQADRARLTPELLVSSIKSILSGRLPAAVMRGGSGRPKRTELLRCVPDLEITDLEKVDAIRRLLTANPSDEALLNFGTAEGKRAVAKKKAKQAMTSRSIVMSGAECISWMEKAAEEKEAAKAAKEARRKEKEVTKQRKEKEKAGKEVAKLEALERERPVLALMDGNGWVRVKTGNLTLTDLRRFIKAHGLSPTSDARDDMVTCVIDALDHRPQGGWKQFGECEYLSCSPP